MKVIKTKAFHRWTLGEKISNRSLLLALDEVERGLIDANLGGQLIKKRLAVGSKGKSGGVRTILVYQENKKAFFIYGFKKNEIDNIGITELKALKKLGELLLSKTDGDINLAIKSKELYEVENEKK